MISQYQEESSNKNKISLKLSILTADGTHYNDANHNQDWHTYRDYDHG